MAKVSLENSKDCVKRVVSKLIIVNELTCFRLRIKQIVYFFLLRYDFDLSGRPK